MVKEIFDPQTDDRDQRIHALEQTLDSLRADSEVAHVLLGLSAALAEVRTVEETLEKTVKIVPELCGADRCFAVTWDDVNNRFDIKAESGFEEELADKLQELATQEDGFPLISRALAERTPLLVGDVVDDGGIDPDRAEARRLGAFIALPLVRWGENFGGLGVEFEHAKQFGAKDAALARGVARQVGVALANARRFNLLQSLRAFGLSVGAQLSLATVVLQTARGAGSLLGGDAAQVYFLEAEKNNLVAASGYGLLQATAEKVNRLDLASEPWAALTRGETVWVPEFDDLFDADEGPASAVLAGIPGPEASLAGAVAVFFKRSVSVGSDETEALNVLAAQAGTAIENAQRFERQRRVARSLQQGLMSMEVPEIREWDFGAIYEPASSDSEVGGDFYDVFEVSERRVALVVGDVSGKGAEAAAQTAMAKYMLRAFAIRNPAPASVLFHLNNALVRGLPEESFTTALYALLDPNDECIQLALGGHPPAMIYRAGSGEVDRIEPEGAIVGAFADQQYDAVTLEIHEGDVFLAYTDGLPETRKGEELYGRRRIVESLTRHTGSPSAKELARRVYEDAAAFGTVSDDTVVFAVIYRAV